jgi:hypothetical protein
MNRYAPFPAARRVGVRRKVAARSPHPRLSAVDSEVVVALIERGFLRLTSTSSDAARPVLLSDLTMVECENVAPSPVIFDCFGRPEGRMEIRSHAGSSLNLATVFRGVAPYRISLPSIDGVQLVDAGHPAVPGQMFAISAPVHLSKRQVAIYFRGPGNSLGAGYLVREKTGWMLRDLAMSPA